MIQKENKADILSVADFLNLTAIRIPEYQRPYKWTEKNVLQLLEDIHTFRNHDYYRFGTIVIHVNPLQEKGETITYNDIVDGQQRYTTIRLIVYALNQLVENSNKYQSNTRELLKELKNSLDSVDLKYKNRISIENIHRNFQLIKRSIQHFDDTAIYNFIQKFQVVVFFIHDDTEAFQFFDSQNSRGKDLYPHDLLKAFHLREFDKNELQLQVKVVDHWEKYATKKLSLLFAEYLFRIKGWSSNQHARYFGKEHVDMFKGISIDKIENYPYVKVLQISHSVVDNYNENFERRIDRQKMDFPFQLDHIMINGRRFFEYVDHYMGINEKFKNTYLVEKSGLNHYTNSELIVNMVYKNKYNYRDGECYLRDLFECVLIYYIDKFGENELATFLEKAFIWCFYLRFDYQRLGFDSLDNYVIKNNLFTVIKNAMQPKDVLKFTQNKLPTYENIKNFSHNDSTRMDKNIVEFFKANHYYAN